MLGVKKVSQVLWKLLLGLNPSRIILLLGSVFVFFKSQNSEETLELKSLLTTHWIESWVITKFSARSHNLSGETIFFLVDSYWPSCQCSQFLSSCKHALWHICNTLEPAKWYVWIALVHKIPFSSLKKQKFTLENAFYYVVTLEKPQRQSASLQECLYPYFPEECSELLRGINSSVHLPNFWSVQEQPRCDTTKEN